jgi:hypothetical protein
MIANREVFTSADRQTVQRSAVGTAYPQEEQVILTAPGTKFHEEDPCDPRGGTFADGARSFSLSVADDAALAVDPSSFFIRVGLPVGREPSLSL